MASTKMRALVSMARLLVGFGIGYAVYYMWSTVRTFDPWFYPFGAGFICAVMGWLLLEKLKGGGD